MKTYPQRIICMTEESVETLYLLGKEDLIVGVSAFVERPPQAEELPTISGFTHANLKKIIGLKPDLVLGFSDIQKDIARDLIGEGFNVFITNQRSLAEILDYILMLGRLVGAENEGQKLVTKYHDRMRSIQKQQPGPKIYLEEWDDPLISGIQWFSELFELYGFQNVFKEKSEGSLAKERFVTHDEIINANPDKIFGCWCGKKVDSESIKSRDGYEKISAVKNDQVFELDPSVFLQPGPALFESGLEIIESFL